ncbi:ABC transporter ATP-binding protein [Krasilnikovia sp. M28-CT-15]|uniref:ABC transporter ATP-binding protein n=1 Tax=Krasilnikovia sp. M28-CT-15 TaxID=3373540 RepID=UPI00399D4E04
MNDTVVRLSGLVRRFGTVRALNGLDLTVARGSTVALLGPNGAGKTTAISIMLGLSPPDGGSATLFGGPPTQAVRAGRVGAMLQDGGFVPNATVRELIELARALYPRPLETARILDVAGLSDRAGRRLDKLSGGEAQRARFAFAVAGHPELLVLDEPTSAMDVAARQAFWAAIGRYTADGGTVVFSTHHLSEADLFADRVVVLAEGRVVADAAPAQIRDLAGGRTVTFDLDGRSVAGLESLPGVRSVEVRGGRVELTTNDSDATVRALAAAGGDLRSLEVTAAPLEAAFLTLTTSGTEH